MAYFPFMIDIENKDCLVVGGGAVAKRKVQVLRGFGAAVTVVAPEVDPGMITPGKEVCILQREYEPSDLTGRFLVIAATDDEELNRRIAADCRERSILVNAVDIKDACSFIFPAMIRQDNLVVSVSTGGDSPAGAAYLKEKLLRCIPVHYEHNLAVLGKNRAVVLEKISSPLCRKNFFYEILRYADENCAELDDAFVREYLEKFLEKAEKNIIE